MAKKKESIFEKPKVEKEDEVSEEPEGFREHEEHSATPEELKTDMSAGKADADVYTEEGREELIEEDEVAEWEEGFSEGEDNPEVAHCAHCGKVLGQDESKIIERDIGHEKFAFCSEACAGKGVKHGKKK